MILPSTPYEKTDPWMYTIPCRTGAEIYPFGGSLLAVEVEGAPSARKRLAALECCRVHQEGDRFASFTFDVADFDAVAAVVRPRVRRRLNPEQKAAAIERLRNAARPRNVPTPDKDSAPQARVDPAA